MTAHLLDGWTATDLLDACRDAIDCALRGAVDRLHGELRVVAGYHLGWLDASGRSLGERASGKAVRPMLTLLTARAARAETNVAMRAAIAVELMHNYTLLHDDVMDQDRLRRHRPTAWTQFGVNQAVDTGNALLSLAFQQVADVGATAASVLARSFVELCVGQSKDLEFETRDDVGLAECIEMAGHKTGSLIAASCALGALAGGAMPAVVDEMHRFGSHVGLAFQLVDDLLGIWGDSEKTGKPVYSDLINRKKSLPVVAALCSGTAAGDKLQRLYREPQQSSNSSLIEMAELIERAGGRQWAVDRVRSEAVEALACLDRTGFDPILAAPLTDTARILGNRSH